MSAHVSAVPQPDGVATLRSEVQRRRPEDTMRVDLAAVVRTATIVLVAVTVI